MKTTSNYLILACLISGTIMLNGCKKESDPISLPSVVTASVSEITQNSAMIRGMIAAGGGAEVTACGFCWSTSQDPSISDNKTFAGKELGAFSNLLTGLTPNTTYHVRAYATNREGITYGEDLTFHTNQSPPLPQELPATLTTMDVFTITSTTASSGGIITDNGDGGITASGVCWSIVQNPTVNDSKTSLGAGSGAFFSILTNLTPNTTYYVRAYATTSSGTTYGNQVTFSTRPSISDSTVPVVITTSVTEITVASAVIGSLITTDGGQGIIDKGICWATNPLPTTSDRRTSNGSYRETETFPDIIYGLQPSTKYYVRAYAMNAVGTGYSNELSFTTSAIGPIMFNSDLAYGSIGDVDGNLYKTIQIGTQIWMAENLRTTKLNDGASIPNVTDDTEWEKLATPGYCWYDNDPSSFKDTYGALYNWYAVNTGKLCPTGWHTPTNAEWNILSDYLGTDAGGKMKETGTTTWVNPNIGANNTSGFTAIPGGSRDPNYQEWRYSTFSNLGYNSSWWSATEYSNIAGHAAWLNNKESNFYDGFQSTKITGLSVRCLKD